MVNGSFTKGCQLFDSLVNSPCSVEDATLISWDHVLDIDEGVFSSVSLESLESLLNKVTQVVSLSLSVVDFVSQVLVASLKEIHNWEDLSVVWHKSLSNSVRAHNKRLQDLEGDGNDFWVAGVQSGFDWDNELRDDWEDLGTTLLEHVKDTLNGQESIWVLLLSDSFEEDWQVVMIVELSYINFPVDSILLSMLDGNWEVSSVVESSEFRWCDSSFSDCTSLWFLLTWFLLWLKEGRSVSTKSHTLLQDTSLLGSDTQLILVERSKWLDLVGLLWEVVLWEVTEH